MFRLTVDGVFMIQGRGAVATGRVEDGAIRVGDRVRINGRKEVEVHGIEAFRKQLDRAQSGDNVGLLFRKLDRHDIKTGDVITGDGDPLGSIAPVAAGPDPRFAAVEAERSQLLTMRDSGLTTDEQIDEQLRARMFDRAGRWWLLTAASPNWLSSDGGPWTPDTPR